MEEYQIIRYKGLIIRSITRIECKKEGLYVYYMDNGKEFTKFLQYVHEVATGGVPTSIEHVGAFHVHMRPYYDDGRVNGEVVCGQLLALRRAD